MFEQLQQLQEIIKQEQLNNFSKLTTYVFNFSDINSKQQNYFQAYILQHEPISTINIRKAKLQEVEKTRLEYNSIDEVTAIDIYGSKQQEISQEELVEPQFWAINQKKKTAFEYITTNYIPIAAIHAKPEVIKDIMNKLQPYFSHIDFRAISNEEKEQLGQTLDEQDKYLALDGYIQADEKEYQQLIKELTH